MSDLYLGASRRARPLPSRLNRPCRSSRLAPLYLAASRRARPLQRSSQVAIPAHRPCRSSRFAPFRFLISENWKGSAVPVISAVDDLKEARDSRDAIAPAGAGRDARATQKHASVRDFEATELGVRYFLDGIL